LLAASKSSSDRIACIQLFERRQSLTD